MNKFIIVIVLSTCTTGLFAQKNSFSVNVGYLKNTSAERDDRQSFINRRLKSSFDNRDGFKAGATVTRQLSKNFISLNVSYANQSYSTDWKDVGYENVTYMNIIQSNITYSIPTFKKLYFTIGVGASYNASLKSEDFSYGNLIKKNYLFFGTIPNTALRPYEVYKHTFNAGLGLTYKLKFFDIYFTNNIGLTPSVKAIPHNIYVSNLELGIAYRLAKF